jgi:dihydroflavonol-4-reductase
MRIVVLGATGLLGRVVLAELAARGHQVLAVSRRIPAPVAAWPDVQVAEVDVVAATSVELRTLLGGYDAVVYGLGPDDRRRVPAPAGAHFRSMLVEPTARVAAAAASAGLRRLVILGSYFTAMDRQHQGWSLAVRHPYIGARSAQSVQARTAGGSDLEVSVIEIPYVFGTVPGIVPMWREVLLDRLRRIPVIPCPAGGTAAVTAAQVGQATATVVEGGSPYRDNPVGDANYTFHELFGIIADELGWRRPLVPVPALAVTAGLMLEVARARSQGLDAGLDPVHTAPDLLARRLFLDVGWSRRVLGHTAGGVEAAIRETVRACSPR